MKCLCFEQHQAPVKVVYYIDELGMLLTGSWDKTVKFWDGRQSNPAGTLNMPERVYCMGALAPLAVIGTAERQVLIYDLRRPQTEFKVHRVLDKQTVCIFTCGYSIQSETRIAVEVSNTLYSVLPR